MVSLGVRTDDKGSGSSVLNRNRMIWTYYHGAQKFGLAQIHILKIGEKVAKATDSEPNQLGIRVRAPGGNVEVLKEYTDEAKRFFGKEGKAVRVRIHRNSDKSIDAQLLIETNGDFKGSLMVAGELEWPKTL